MPRANRHFVPGYVWHITHRCHRKAFLLKFARDRRRYLNWLFEAKKRFGLCVLNYAVTSNHIHLLVKDSAADVIPQSMQLVAGRTAQDVMLKNSDPGCSKGSQMRGAREIDERRRTCRYVGARRSSATTQVSRFQQPVTDGTFTRLETAEAYSDVFAVESDALRLDNRLFWDEPFGKTAT